NDLAAFDDPRSVPVVNYGGCQQTEAGMAMLLVVPGEKGLAERTAVLNRAEAIWKIWPVLQGAEVAFLIGVFIGYVRRAVGFGDAQIGQQKSHRFGSHGGAAIGVNGQ